LILTGVVRKRSPKTAQALAGLEQGWSQSLEKLESFAQG